MPENFSTEQVNALAGVLSISIMMDGQHNVLVNSGDIIELYFIEDIFSHVLIGKIRFFDPRPGRPGSGYPVRRFQAAGGHHRRGIH